MTSRSTRTLCAMLLILMASRPVQAQEARAADVASPEAIVAAAYDVLARAPGEPFDWDRFRTLYLPQATLIPNTEQTGGVFRILSPEAFIAWIDSVTTVGGPSDQGFAEEAIHNRVERYGDVAHVWSTYQKHFWEDDEILGRGINSFQLVWRDGRWWIASVVWDEESGAGPIPDAYLR